MVWIFAWGIFYFLRQFGIEEYPYVVFSKEPHRLLHFGIHTGAGVLTGIMYGTAELVFERSFFQRRSYGSIILIKSAVYLIMAFLLMTLAIITFQTILHGEILWSKLASWLGSKNFLVVIVHFMITSILISFIRQMNYKFGPGVLWNMLIGKYHHPREEERIFMFLDLRSSTTIAEKLGHIQFSRFIQDCFFDLTEIVLMHEVDIYQYVGDEAVLSWQVKKGIEKNHCLAAYFDFKQKLESRKNYYKEQYGIQPFFKAGIHMGRVTVAEVGVIKKEIAYHGDVLNTAARIQGKCNELNQGLLISQDLKNEIEINNQFVAKKMGVEILRGKQQEVAIYGIEAMY